MNYKARRDGFYEVVFEAKDLPTIIELVQQSEIWRKEEIEQNIIALEKAAKELNEERGDTPPPQTQ